MYKPDKLFPLSVPDAPVEAVRSVAARRLAFIALLRDPMKWPEGFKWAYGDCSTCAIGLMCRTKLIRESVTSVNVRIGDSEESAVSQYLGISPEETFAIFWRCGGWGPFNRGFSITPQMVADELEVLHRKIRAAS